MKFLRGAFSFICAPIVLFLAIPSAPASAQNDFFNTLNVNIASSTADPTSSYSLLGWVTGKLAYGYEKPDSLFSRNDRAFNKAETSLFAQLDWRGSNAVSFRISGKAYHDEIYNLENEFPYTRAERNEFRNRFEIKDFYLQTQFDNGGYLKLGNQILAWGMSEFLRVTDVINPEDQYSFGQQDLEDLRLQVPAALFTFNSGDWVLDSVVTYRAGYNDMAPAADEFDQWLGFRQGNNTLHRQDPGSDWGFHFRASTNYRRGDLQLVISDANSNQLTLNGIAYHANAADISFAQQRIQVLGAAANFVSGTWLLYGELGIHHNRPIIPDSSTANVNPAGLDETDQLLAVVGAEYNGFRNLLISLEVDSVRLLDHDDTRLATRQQHSFGTRFYWTALNERLQVLGVWNYLANDSGYLTRLSVDYNWSDNIEVGFMWVDYGAGNGSSLLRPFRNNDTLQMHLRYSFQR